MSKKTITGDDGKKYEVQKDGTLKEKSSSSGGIIGALIDSAENVVKTGVDAVLRKSGSKKK